MSDRIERRATRARRLAVGQLPFAAGVPSTDWRRGSCAVFPPPVVVPAGTGKQVRRDWSGVWHTLKPKTDIGQIQNAPIAEGG